VDVVVCDGYAGNIALKTGEGVGRMTGYYFKEAISSDPLAILGGALAFFAMKRFKHKVDPRLYNGGVFVGPERRVRQKPWRHGRSRIFERGASGDTTRAAGLRQESVR
jgi:fatty acid/phospholipid biosynthesis enzyme